MDFKEDIYLSKGKGKEEKRRKIRKGERKDKKERVGCRK
jgi:hypothetical protein